VGLYWLRARVPVPINKISFDAPAYTAAVIGHAIGNTGQVLPWYGSKVSSLRVKVSSTQSPKFNVLQAFCDKIKKDEKFNLFLGYLSKSPLHNIRERLTAK
jgi:hypothetical protein